ncbi:MAG: TlpA disulfide reductase family protein, partial [Armatimonadota bacterium]
KAPAFPVAGFVKGDKIDHLELGKMYVIEFWATWCGPCIASMPHLSDMADKYQGKVNFVSVNTWDFRTNDPKVKEEADVHAKRVSDWVTKNNDKMRYNIVLDDAKDTIATTWMRAAGQNGIPCAMIVNEDGKIAWIGHPMSMEKPLEEVSNKTWDINAFKVKFDKQIADAKAAAEAQKKLAADFKAGDMAAIDAYINAKGGNKSQNAMSAISTGMRSNPDMAFTVFKKYAHMAPASEAANWCSMASGLVRTLKTDEAKNELAAMCGECTSMAEPKVAALAYTYHASVLNSVGKKEEAAKWIEKAKAAVSTFEPANQHDALMNFINQTAKSFEKN